MLYLEINLIAKFNIWMMMEGPSKTANIKIIDGVK